MKLTLKALAPLVLAAMSAPAFAQPTGVTIDSITYAGTGCPAGSVAENLSDDAKAFTLLFDSYVAEAGPGLPLTESRKACTINVDMRFPAGWSFTIVDVDYRGFVSLDRLVQGVQQSDYYFQGQTGSARLTSTFNGPISQDYEFRDTLGVTAQVWSPCGANRSLNIKTQVRVDNLRNRRAAGIMTLDSIDGQLTHIYGLQWRRCR